MTREEIMQLNTDYLNGCESEHKMNELFNYVLELQKHEQESDKNCISRSAVLNKIPLLWNSYGDKDYCMETLRDFVSELPPIPSQPKIGEWILNKQINDNYQCSECGMFLGITKEDVEEGWELPNYCSNCGAVNHKGEI